MSEVSLTWKMKRLIKQKKQAWINRLQENFKTIKLVKTFELNFTLLKQIKSVLLVSRNNNLDLHEQFT